eukprot:scaffold12369_cov97-Cylindrotheca_fusiformis.AAC.11
MRRDRCSLRLLRLVATAILVTINCVWGYSFVTHWDLNAPLPTSLSSCHNIKIRPPRIASGTRLHHSKSDSSATIDQGHDLSVSERKLLQHSIASNEVDEGFEKEEVLLKKAIAFAKQHAANGHRSWDQTIGVACLIADLKLDMASIVASILVWNLPNERDSKQKVHDQFGSDVQSLVERLQSLEDIPSYSPTKHDPEKYQKLLVAIADDDVRVIVIKLADQTEKVKRQLKLFQEHQPNEEVALLQRNEQTAREALDVLAPLAHRLGIYSLKTSLEDMALQLWKPKVYQDIQHLVATRQEEYQLYTDQVIGILASLLKEAGMIKGKSSTISVSGRAKSYYSIYKKMETKEVEFGDVQDLIGFRILVEDVSQCYQALGVIYDQWKPLKGRFKDYIAQPKLNGYKSLHTTVVGHEDRNMEVQIRTHEMHEIAESGVAAHWIYKRGKNKGRMEDAQHFQWLRELVECIQMDERDDKESEGSSMESFHRNVFVFSPQGNLFALAGGSSVLDFAYGVHSELGHHCTGAKVDGRMVPLKYKLKNGDTIDVLKSNNQTPKKEWLEIVKTSKAKSRIKAWLKKSELGTESFEIGKEMLETALKKYASRQQEAVDTMAYYKEHHEHLLTEFHLKDEQELFQAVAYGQIKTRTLLQELFKLPPRRQEPLALKEDGDEVVIESQATVDVRPPKSGGVVIGGERNMLVTFCRSCNPLHGEDVQGVITQGRGVKIHRLGCLYLQQTAAERRLDAVWDEKTSAKSRPTQIEVFCEDSPGALASMSKAISAAKVSIGRTTLKKVSSDRSVARFNLMLRSIDELKTVMQQLEQEPDIISVKRM